MSVDTNQVIRSAADKFFCRPVGRAMANPLALAAMVTIAIMIIVYFSFDKDHVFRTTLRVFATATAFMFINNHILIGEKRCALLNDEQRDVLRVISAGDKSQIVRPSTIAGGINDGLPEPEAGDEDDGMIIEGRVDA